MMRYGYGGEDLHRNRRGALLARKQSEALLPLSAFGQRSDEVANSDVP
jgi:hypothetical protein